MRQPIPLPVVQGSSAAERERDTSRPVMLVGFQHQGNLGLGYLAAVLREQGYSVRVVDIAQKPSEILRIAQELNPILIGFSLIFQFFIDRYAALLYVLRLNGIDSHFTMGGHFPSLSYDQTLELVPELDSIVRFEGEATLLEMVDAIVAGKDCSSIHGLAYRDGAGRVIVTRPRALLEDLDQLPYPDREHEPESVLGRSIL